MAGITLPRLETAVDCAPIGYPGIEVVFWLNPPFHEDEATGADDSWDTVWYRQMGRVIERVIVPGDYTEDGEASVLGVGGAQELWELERDDDFDPQILTWAFGVYAQERAERTRTERKNS